ncbi:2Fe-2S iron-sulfur cluster binding domain-containing protein [Geodermatophilus sp. TF02-6]|uniref:2Fe-2S iron-sulfur cluster-binding protein n=1 Tax=Geodermatophilus sp. TF02-6 TaxID=2250575 RepID=UPI001F418E1F|nr:2Fe-2S iron-sulfur cluster binding domain-containing protein [Geodermatophilus sp. TF02-6]
MTAASGSAVDPAPLQVVCAAAGIDLVVPPGTSILDAVRDAGLPVTAACTGACCGSCETRVLEGEPEHRDAVLTAEERAFGDTMMICVSGARSGRLVLDL